MIEMDLKVTGLYEAIDQLTYLVSPNTMQAIIKGCLKESLKPIRTNAAARLGKLGRIWTGTQQIGMSESGVIAKIGIGVVAKHWAEIFREYGTIERYLTGYKKYRTLAKKMGDTRQARVYARQFMMKGARRGRIKLNPFIRPAVDSKLNESVKMATEYLQTEVTRIIEGREKALKLIPDFEQVI
jgi:hypothetical protein